MHNRKTQPRQLTKLETEEAWNAIHKAEALIAKFAHQPQLSLTHAQTVMTVTSKILEFNPDVSSLYTLRRRAIATLLPGDARQAIQRLMTPGAVLENDLGEQTLLDAELEYIKLLSPVKPIKAYSIWHHMIWLLCATLRCSVNPVSDDETETFHPIPDSWTTISGGEFFDGACGPGNWRHQTDLLVAVLCTFEKFGISELRKDGRNFHCWSFLTLIYRLMTDIDDIENAHPDKIVDEQKYLERLGDLADAELDRSNYCNSSVFHMRRIIQSDIATELSWLRHACFAVPEREGPWLHLECIIQQEILRRKYPMPIFRDLITEFLAFLRKGWIETDEPVPWRAQKAKKLLEGLLRNHPLFLASS